MWGFMCTFATNINSAKNMDKRYNGWFDKDIYFGSSHSVFRDISVERSEILEVLEKSLWKDGL